MAAKKFLDFDTALERGLSPEEKLAGDMLVFSTALMMVASMLWLAIYWGFGQRFSTLIPLIFLLTSLCVGFRFAERGIGLVDCHD